MPECPRTAEVLASLRHALTSIERWGSRRATWERLSGGAASLTRTDVWLLERIADCGPARMSALARWQSVDRSTITAQVNRLESNGLITRGPDPADRRAVQVDLTADGHAVMREHRSRLATTMEDLTAAWPAADVTEFGRLLSRFARALDDDLADRAD
ncbi:MULTISPECIES: MarR family winged helix-turn-helix transcriptional regulator [unclassified Brevibacterium]|uniref:MarR family winged helix-turn-helix transcriptional regulator n=1 Tax=unclassified Brevibacterium TaxID=2614124 RepID=UPI0010C7BC32|nr:MULTISPECIES: MarR family transcriptional regulator [unclassified Brevibacterium]MCK1803298.1 MarR family transcriptional regulator [Brevibacterium sp. R8603A2]QCP04330.1 MarR family transcriptional regulator [Brevibacterium sp. CS2]